MLPSEGLFSNGTSSHPMYQRPKQTDCRLMSVTCFQFHFLPLSAFIASELNVNLTNFWLLIISLRNLRQRWTSQQLMRMMLIQNMYHTWGRPLASRVYRTIWSRSSYSQKQILNMASARHLEFGNFWTFVNFSSPWSKFASAYQISSNSDASRLRYNDFQNGGRPPCWIFESWHFHHQTFVCVRLCLLIPNFVLIGQYGAEL